MTATPIDYATPLGYVRLLISDTATDPQQQLLTDAEINGFLANEANTLAAAAAALETIATNSVLVMKKITSQDLSMDGPAMAEQLRAIAATYRGRAAAETAGRVRGAGSVDLAHSAAAELRQRRVSGNWGPGW